MKARLRAGVDDVVAEWQLTRRKVSGPRHTETMYELQLAPHQMLTGLNQSCVVGLIVRSLQREDAEVVTSITEKAFGLRRLAPPDPAEGWDLRPRPPAFGPTTVSVAELDGQVVGYCWSCPGPAGQVDLVAVAVHPDAAGQGVARRLVTEACAAHAPAPYGPRARAFLPASEPALVRSAVAAGFDVTRALHRPSPEPGRQDGPAGTSGGPGLEVDVVGVDRALADEWERMATTTGAQDFSRPGWFLAWADAFVGGDLYCVTGRRNGSLVALLPVIRRGRLLRSATNGETPWLRPLLAEPSVAPALLTAASRHCRRLRIDYLPSEDPLALLLSEPDARPRAGLVRRVIRRSPVVYTDGDYEQFLSARTPRHREWRRHERVAAEQGEVTFELEDGRRDLERLLEEGFSVEASGWKAAEGTAVLSRPAARLFYWDASRWAAGNGHLRLAFLRIDGVAVAFAHLLVSAGVMSMTKLAHHPDYGRGAPGITLVRHLIARAFADPGIYRFDFLGESERYKLVFADRAETQLGFDVYFGGPVAQVRRAARLGLWSARDRVRRRVPVDVRNRVDLGSPTAAARTLVTAGREGLRRGSHG